MLRPWGVPSGRPAGKANAGHKHHLKHRLDKADLALVYPNLSGSSCSARVLLPVRVVCALYSTPYKTCTIVAQNTFVGSSAVTTRGRNCYQIVLLGNRVFAAIYRVGCECLCASFWTNGPCVDCHVPINVPRFVDNTSTPQAITDPFYREQREGDLCTQGMTKDRTQHLEQQHDRPSKSI